jgi:hypothetical protein
VTSRRIGERMTKAVVDSSWTARSLGVLERACDHYGGFETWAALSEVRLFPGRLSGLVPWLKGSGQTFPVPSAFEIRPHERWARFQSYPDPEHVGIFDNGAVRIERCDTNETLLRADDQRASFRGLAKSRRWTAIDALYFFGYALTHYHSLPFSLLDARLVRASEIGSRGDPLTVLDVELPADLPTHCRRQSFYFDKSGRLARHDYHAEVLGFWARGAHFWRRQASFNGFPISLDRQVLARLGSFACPILALRATFVDAEVELGRVAPSNGDSPR